MNDTLDCAAVRELLSGYLDGELPPEQASDVARHLATCAECATELENLRRVSAKMREQMQPVAAPDLLRARVRAALRDSAQTAPARVRESRWRRRFAAGVIIAVASSALTIGVIKYQSSPAEPGAEQVLAAHVRSLMANHLTDVTSNDNHNVKPWFNGKVAFSPEVTRLDSVGFPLIGGRVDSIGKTPVAAIVYGRRLHMINMFTWPSPIIIETDSVSSARGYNAIHWTRGGMSFWAVSDVNMADLRYFVNAFRRFK